MFVNIVLALKENLKKARFNLSEVAGSFGDMGTFLPLLVAMAQINGLDFAAGLFFAGMGNLLTGLTFAIPMAVQPMKAIAAVSITEGLSVPQILAAGVWVSVVVMLLGIFGGIDWIIKLVPKSVIRGIQLALGLSLASKGVQMAANLSWISGHDNIALGMVAFVLVLWTRQFKRFPTALVLFFSGLVITLYFSNRAMTPKMIFWMPKLYHFQAQDFWISFYKAALPQIPLTVLNSVIAVCALSADLFPHEKLAPKKVAVSVAMLNLLSAWFGGMPMCHGSGGLAGQHRFGARTNGSILFLGLFKITLAVLFGATLMSLCKSYPQSILGVMLLFSGMNLALVCKDQNQTPDMFVMLVTTAIGLGSSNIALGFLAGLLVAKGLGKKIHGSNS